MTTTQSTPPPETAENPPVREQRLVLPCCGAEAGPHADAKFCWWCGVGITERKPHGEIPLLVTIHGPGACSGKTVLQLLLADVLRERGHAVYVSDAAVGDAITKHVVKRHEAGGQGEVIPMPVYLHVSASKVTDPLSHLDGQTPLLLPKSTQKE